MIRHILRSNHLVQAPTGKLISNHDGGGNAPAFLLPMMVHRPHGRPTSGLLMPAEWRRELAREGFEVNDETVTDGSCGIHAFAIALIDAAESDESP